jgi:hypothetical protein
VAAATKRSSSKVEKTLFQLLSLMPAM